MAESLDIVKWEELKNNDTMYSYLSEEHKKKLDSLFKARIDELKQYDSCTKTQDTNILNAYLQQYDDTVESFPTHVKDVRYIKQRLKENPKKAQGNSVPQPSSQNAKSKSQKVETKNTGGKPNLDVKKTEINNLSGLFDALKNANDGAKKFFDKYYISEKNRGLQKRANEIMDKCYEKGLAKSVYQNYYEEAMKAEGGASKQIEKLEELLDIKKQRKQ